MRVLFCHDGPLRKDEFNNYYGNGHNNETLKRYLNIADNLSVLMRTKDNLKKEAELAFSKITIPSLEIIECPNISSLKGMLLNRWKSKKVIKDAVLKSDYIVARLPSFFGLLAIDFAKKFGKPYLIEVVACPWDALWNHSFKGKLMAPLMYYKTRRSVNEAPYSIYVTEKFLQNRYPNKGRSIGCSDVSLPYNNVVILEKRLEKIRNMNPNNPLILGTIAAVDVRYKGQEYVIKAISNLNRNGFNFEYHLVGGGSNKNLSLLAMRLGVEDKVKFLGSLSHTQIFDYLDSIDIYIQPSQVEGLPRALVEAMSRGCPALGSNIGGIPELLSKESLFSKGRVSEISELLKGMNKEIMLRKAVLNFEKTKSFDLTLLNKKRNDFFKCFKDAYKNTSF